MNRLLFCLVVAFVGACLLLADRPTVTAPPIQFIVTDRLPEPSPKLPDPIPPDNESDTIEINDTAPHPTPPDLVSGGATTAAEPESRADCRGGACGTAATHPRFFRRILRGRR